MKVLKESSNFGRSTGERRGLTCQDSSSPTPTDPLPAQAPSLTKILAEREREQLPSYTLPRHLQIKNCAVLRCGQEHRSPASG